MALARACWYVLGVYVCLAGAAAPVLGQQSISALALRAQKTLSQQSSVDGTLTARWREGINVHDRGIAQLGFTRRLSGGNDVNVSYQVQFLRNGQLGVEHRWAQQLRHRIQFNTGTYELSGRFEERYLPGHRSGERLRLINRWSRPLYGGQVLQLGHEWMYNLNDLSVSTQRGLSQNRLILGLQQPLENGDRLDWEYQFGLLHAVNGPHALQHQIQLRYSLNL